MGMHLFNAILNKFDGLNFSSAETNWQTTKFNSIPTFPAIWYAYDYIVLPRAYELPKAVKKHETLFDYSILA